MLLSMTGQGQGRRPYAAAEISAEVRAVNNRHLKMQIRTCETLNALEPQIETIFLVANPNVSYISSSLIKQIYKLGGKIDQFVPKLVAEKIKGK